MRTTAIVAAVFGLLALGAVGFGRLALDRASPQSAAEAVGAERVPSLEEVLPLGEEGYREAAEAALLHADAYGTFRPGEAEGRYAERIRSAAALADVPDGPVLESIGACAERLDREGRETEGAAEIRAVSSLLADSVHFTVALAGVPVDGGAEVDLGVHEVLVILEGGEEWTVASSAPESGAAA
ncbi:hypothetical protein J0910_18890 [Nocardiopsis sp. CNT-189]|uniref:hypothetical protein n=1 Tax=Nocardiopsis oceanisediminis TaxID=2816862 RepID=UPI003B2DFAB6